MRWHTVAGGAGPASHGTTLFGAHATRKPTIVGRSVSAWIDKHEPEHINYFDSAQGGKLSTYLDRTW